MPHWFALMLHNKKLGLFGLPIDLSIGKGGLLVKVVGKAKLTLAQRLAAFDPERHGGEAEATFLIGSELL